MAQLGNTFDASTVEPAQDFDVLPAGKYKVQIIASEMRPTKSGDGGYLWLEMEILDGQFHGRKIWDRLNIENQNEKAKEIATRQFAALCHATGKLRVSDSEELHFTPVMATVRVRPANDKYDASNEIRGYSAIGAAAPVYSHQQVQAAPQARPAAPSVAPWKQKLAG